jgi:uncharacterized protein (TIGR02996 family)
MTAAAALLAAIRQSPDDDAPRLVYADWLDEHGQPERAEFIRVQVESANLQWDDQRWNPLAEEAKELLEARGEEWIEPFAWLSPGGKTEVYLDKPTIEGRGGGVQLSWLDPSPSDMGDVAPPYERAFDFHRGFVRRIHLEPEALLHLPDHLFSLAPAPQALINWVPEFGNQGRIAELWAGVSRALRTRAFTDWAFSNFNHEVGWLPLLAQDADVARQVSGLYIDEGEGGLADSDLIALYPLVPLLEDLRLSYSQWSPTAIRELGRYGLNSRLRHLEYRENRSAAGRISAADTLAAIAKVGSWPRLRSLTLDGLESVHEEVASLIRGGLLPALRKLSFWGPGGTPEFFAAILQSPHLAHVGRIEYWHYGTVWERNPAIRELAERSGGRFQYR